MSLSAIFTTLKSRNIALLEEGGELVIRAPQGAMDSALMDKLKAYKQELLATLQAGASAVRTNPADITPDMLPLVDLSQDEIDGIINTIEGGAANVQDIYPLAPLQEGILFHHLLDTQGDPYVTRSLIVFDNRTYLDAFLAALQTVIDRHDILRSSVHWQGLRQPVQVVHRRAVLPVQELAGGGNVESRLLDATDPRKWRMTIQQAPLLAVYMAADPDGERWRLVLLNHHLVDDNYTLQLILSEIQLLLAGRGAELPVPLPYRNFVARMRRNAQAEHETYFRDQLGDVDETTAPFGVLNVQDNGGKVEETVMMLDGTLSQRIRDASRGCSVTPASLFHVAWALVMGRCSGRDDVVFGTVLSGRLHSGVGAERAVGLFINTLPVRIPLAKLSAAETVALTHQRLNELLLHEQASLATAQRCSGLAVGMPLFTSLLNYRHSSIVASDDKVLMAWEGAEVVFSEERTNYPLTLSVDDLGRDFGLTVQAAQGIEPRHVVEYLRTAISGLADALLREATRPVNEINILPADELHQVLVDWNATRTPYPKERCIHQLFEAQVEQTPDAIALTFENQTLTYADLNIKANRLAHYLIERGVGPNVLVGLCIERSPEMVTGLLGILKAGGAYVPLDPHYPEERLRYLLGDAGIGLLLTRPALAAVIAADARQTVYLDQDWPMIARYPAHNPAPRNHPLDLAYIIYTSGSTGEPKGVAVSHLNAVHSTVARFAHYADPVKAYLLLSSFAFDSSVAGIFWTLGQGGCLCLPGDDAGKDPAVLAALIEREQVSHLLALPSLYAALLEQAQPQASLGSLTTAIVAGEACATEVVKRHFAVLPAVKLYNEYGPTEGTVWSSVYQAGPEDLERPLAIGRPLNNVRLYILDAAANPVPVGVAGELYIGGAGIVRGYLRRAALTAERFLPDPFRPDGGRLYRTGDLARYRADGAIEFLGRIDHQVKLRGFRIELGEIEAQLLAHPAVKDAAVLAREDQPGDKKLVAYLVLDSASANQDAAVLDDLKAQLKQALPDYMMPAAFIILDAMPLSANGKLERKRLPAPDWSGQSGAAYAAPQTPVEAALAQVWQQLLAVERVGRHDNFFALGGDSILSIQMVSRARQAGIVATPKQLFQHPTLAELAAVAGAASRAVAEQGPVSGEAPLTPIQHWFFERALATPQHWNQAVLLSVKPGLTPAVFEAALHKLLSQHDALRLRFTAADGRWRQRHAADDSSCVFERLDLSAVPAAERSARLQAEATARQAALDLSQGPLLRAVWFDFGDEASQVLVAIHHLVVDGVSWRILLEDLSLACRQGQAGQSLSLPAKTTSFKHWAGRLTELTQSGSLNLHADYWLDPRRREAPALPVDEPAGANLSGLEDEIVATLSRDDTRALLQDVPAAYRSQIDDVLLTALALTLREWTQSSTLLIDREGHGREHLADDLDVSRTVGWFTSVYPLLLRLDAGDDLGRALKTVKEQLRAVPAHGIGYGLLRYLSADTELKQRLAAQPQARIIFNYLGQLDSVLDADGLFAASHESAGLSLDPAGERAHELDVVGSILDGRLQLSWRYSRARYRRSTLESLAARYLQHLQALIAHCREPDTGGYTPSDFPLATLSQTQLDALALPPRQIEDIYPLAPLQHGLMFHSLYAPNATVYRIQLACRLTGKLDIAAFRQAWQLLLERHALLRTRFYGQDLEQPLQIVEHHVLLPISFYDWSGLPEAAQQQRWRQLQADDHAQGFDFGRAPLMRLALAQTADTVHYLLWSYHHVLLDGWSMPLLIKEVFTLYHALQRGDRPSLPAVKPYRDYIAWLQRQDRAAAERYWKEAMAGFDTPTVLGIDRAPGRQGAGETRKHRLLLTAAETRRLQQFVRQQQLTLNTLAQAAWGLLLSRYSGSDDVVFGVTVSGRPADLIGIEAQVGLFINTLPMRVQVKPEARLDDWLQGLFAQNQDMRRYEYAPLAQIQTGSDIGRGQNLFDSLLVFENYPIDEALMQIGGPLTIDAVVGVDPTNYPLTLTVFPGERLQLEINHDSSRFTGDSIAAMLAHLQQLLVAFAEQPQAKLANLPTLVAAERRQILDDWNATEVDYPKGRCIHQLFEAQAARTPDAVALKFEDRSLSYAELNAKANQLAHYLRARGVGPDVLVGICIERSLEMVIGLLGILKAGGAYVPLDPNYPEERLAFMLADIAPPVVLTQAKFVGERYFGAAQLLSLDGDWERVESYSAVNPDGGLRPDNLAYCIYTSGSTGQPKGAGVPHQGILNRLQWMQAEYRLDGSDSVLQKTPYSFDVSVWEFFWPLMTGARLVVAAPELHKDSLGLAELIRRERITTLHFVPSMLQAFVETPAVENCTSLTRVICSGEALSADLVARFQQKLPAALHNLYGPTEASVDVSYWACPPACSEAAIPIGKPIANIRLYILDRHLNPVPVGTPGELHIAGIGLGHGYLRRPGLSAEKFIPDPYGPEGSRMYKTGDRVRYRADGTIDYLGRIDHQVKLRGFRIELGEIEAQLLAHAAVKEAVVLAREDHPGDKRLVAYLVEDQLGTLPLDDLKAQLKQALPDYMVPSAFVMLAEMPLSANGKLDRKRLPAPDIGDQLATQYVAPRSGSETILAEIWQDVLGIEKVGVEDDFFELGGHSLLATQLFFLAQKRLATAVTFKAFLVEPTIAAQARLIDEGEAAEPVIDLDADAVLDPTIVPITSDKVDAAAARVMLLTGATGFLGAFLLADLLELTQARIYCLIRAEDERQAMRRLQRQIEQYELSDRVDFSRVVAVCGDLGEPRLGLSECRYRDIAEQVEVIYHNGALVNFVQPYQALKAANVFGTQEVLRLACLGKAKAIHYVSTVSVFSEEPKQTTGHKETDDPVQRGHLPTGYAQSKWVAEKLAVAARERGFQVSIYRPAIVAGDRRNGVWNTSDFWCRLIKGCMQMGYAPCERVRVDMAPVDYMSRSVVALSLTSAADGNIFHLNHPEPPYSDQWLDGFADLGYEVQRIPYRNWLEKVLETGRTRPEDFALASLLPSFAEQLQAGDTQLPEGDVMQYDSSATHAALSALGVECAPMDGNDLARYQAYWVRSGFIRKPDYADRF